MTFSKWTKIKERITENIERLCTVLMYAGPNQKHINLPMNCCQSEIHRWVMHM